MSKKQFYGIKYPFTSASVENYFIDLNHDVKSKIKSLLIHVVFTPKGQKVRDPEFGTNLVKFLFEPNDSMTWDNIKDDIMSTVGRYVNGVKINDIIVLPPDENRHDVYVRLDYTISDGITVENDSLITKV